MWNFSFDICNHYIVSLFEGSTLGLSFLWKFSGQQYK